MNGSLAGASALVILAALAGSPATAIAHESKSCNVLLDGDGNPVVDSDSRGIAHSNSSECDDDDEKAEAEDKDDKDEEVSVANEEADAEAEVIAAPAVVAEPLSLYFDSGKDDLDAGGQAEVNAYVADLLATAPQSISVVGYTDTLGPPEINRRLSEARAKNVTSALVEAGVPEKLISQGASGEDILAVDTPDDTREASNRRVTITPAY